MPQLDTASVKPVVTHWVRSDQFVFNKRKELKYEVFAMMFSLIARDQLIIPLHVTGSTLALTVTHECLIGEYRGINADVHQ